MKTIISTIIITILILFIGFFNLSFLGNESSEFLDILESLYTKVKKEDWKAASSQYNIINEKWSDSHEKYMILVDHYEIDNINMSFSELKAYIDTKNKSLSLAKILNLKLLIDHITEKEALTLKNIL